VGVCPIDANLGDCSVFNIDRSFDNPDGRRKLIDSSQKEMNVAYPRTHKWATRPKGLRAIALIACFPLCASGCLVSRVPYPKAWPERSESIGKECKGISGTYLARQIASSDGVVGNSYELGSIMFWLQYGYESLGKGKGLEVRRTKYVVLDVQHKLASVVLLDDSAEIMNFPLKNGKYEFKCHRDFMEFSRASGFVDLFTVGLESDLWRLSRADDESLVVMRRLGGAAVLMLPAAGSDTTWIRFERVPDATVHGLTRTEERAEK